MKAQLALLDAAMVFSAGFIALWIRERSGIFESRDVFPWDEYLFPLTLVTITYLLVLRYFGMYRPEIVTRIGRRLAKAAIVAMAAVLFLNFFYRAETYSRITVVIFIPLSVLFLRSGRWVYGRFMAGLRNRSAATRNVLIVGAGPAGRRIGRVLSREPLYYRLVGYLDDLATGQAITGVEILGTTEHLPEVIDSDGVDEVIVAMPEASRGEVLDLVGVCMFRGVTWKVAPEARGLAFDRMALDDVSGVPLLSVKGAQVVGLAWFLKRTFDVVVAGAALVLTSPIILLAALAVKLTSPGPVFYRQERIGMDGRPFTMVKFRSMRTDNDASTHKDFTADWIYGKTGQSDNGVHKIVADPRITPVGKVIRKLSIDELPQLFNVVRGDMSVVGPRPPTPYEYERYSEWHKRRMEVLPGITGLWQISGRNELSFEEMVELDIRYIERWSLGNDMRIVVRTLPAMVKGSGY